MRSLRRLALAASILALASALCFAQTTGEIRGTVVDAHGAGLPGATVEISSPALQGVRTTITGAGGAFTLPALPPGTYRVVVSMAGFSKAAQQTQVRLGATASVATTLQVAAAEQVVVTGEAPVVDLNTTTGGSNYSAAIIDRLPVGRNYTDIVKSNPGVSQDRADRQGRSAALTVYGSTSAENSFIIDGVDTTNVIRGLQGKAINNEFIQEVEVKTDSYRAEYGNATGGIVNVITKSGGNEFQGSVFALYNSASLRANEVFTANDSDTFTGTLTPGEVKWDYGANLGGYVLKDRLWFFGAYNRITDNQTIAAPRGVAEGIEVPLDSTSNLWSGKLTWNITAGATLVGTVFADPSIQEGAVRPPNSLDPGSYLGTRDIGGTDFGARGSVLFGSVGLLTLQGSRHNDRFELSLTPEGNVIQFTDERGEPPFPVTGGLGRINGYQDFNRSHRDQFQGDFVAYFQNHEVKVGAAYVKRSTEAIDSFTGGQQVSERKDLITDQVYYAHTFFAGRQNGEIVPLPFNDVHLNSVDYSAFVQDSWRILPNLTADVGLRFDRTDVKGVGGTVVSRLTNEWQPRIGVIWDPSGQGTAKVYGFYGRFYYAIPTDINVRDFGSELFVTTYNFDPTDTVHDPTAPNHPRPDQQGGAFNEPIDANIRGMYQDEFTLGVEKALDPTFSVELKGMYRRLGNAIDDRCDLDYSAEVNLGNSCANINPGGDGLWASGNFPWYDGYTSGVGFHDAPAPQSPKAKRLYRAIQVSARKTIGKELWLQASYIYSSVRGNYDGAVHESTGQTDPGLNEDFDYPATYANAYGRLFLDRPHQFRVDAAYASPLGFNVGLQFYVRSGVPLDQLRFDWPDYLGSNLYMVPRGSAGRTPTEYEANLNVGYTLKAGLVEIVPQIYVYNLLNRQSETYQNIQYITGPEGDVNQINPDFGKVVARTPPRQLVFGLKVLF